ncbi:hypothetical protein FOL75_04840 [Bacillus thuringiensis]|uniref:hypothetical protein n=1 Tax=Bacillus thuringiensis TaxID=1428 RepID=UPI002853D611|nr:hypothetical protein [Bacillus thuringiensis]MDR5021397.1 hypothetical protein [Bacillus thuringiensis]
MLLKNFLLSRAKTELSPQLKHLSKTPTGNVNRAIKKVIAEIDNIVIENEGQTAKEYLKTKRRYQALQTVLSFLVHEGYSQFRQDYISQKSGISKPLINDVLAWLEDLGICQQIKTRTDGKKAPSIYILTLHNNYLKIIEYFKTKWALLIEVTSTFTEQLQKKIFNKKGTATNTEDTPKVSSKGIGFFNLEDEQKQEESNNESEEPKDYTARKVDFNEYLSADQQRAWHYLMSSPFTNLSEKDAYAIANRMPPDIDRDAWYFFRQATERFEASKADKSNVAYFIEIFSKNYKSYLKRKKQEAEEYNKGLGKKQETNFIYYDWVKDN